MKYLFQEGFSLGVALHTYTRTHTLRVTVTFQHEHNPSPLWFSTFYSFQEARGTLKFLLNCPDDTGHPIADS